MTKVRAAATNARHRIRRWLDATTTRRQVLPAYVLLAVGAVSAFWLDARQDSEREHDRCVASASTRGDNRLQWLATYQFFDERDPSSLVFTDPLRALLNDNLPALDPRDC